MKNSGAICRNASPDKPFTSICNSVLKDYSLSLEAVGFLARFLAMPRDWSASLAWARKHFRIGEQKAERIMGELIEKGYVRRAERERRKNGTLGPVLYEFTDLPFVFSDDDHAVKNHPVDTHPVASHAVKNTPYTKEREDKRKTEQITPKPPLEGGVDNSIYLSNGKGEECAVRRTRRPSRRRSMSSFIPDEKKLQEALDRAIASRQQENSK